MHRECPIFISPQPLEVCALVELCIVRMVEFSTADNQLTAADRCSHHSLDSTHKQPGSKQVLLKTPIHNNNNNTVVTAGIVQTIVLGGIHNNNNRLYRIGHIAVTLAAVRFVSGFYPHASGPGSDLNPIFPVQLVAVVKLVLKYLPSFSTKKKKKRKKKRRRKRHKHDTCVHCEYGEMDFTVEATVDLNNFPDKSQAIEILRSKGFVLEDLGGDHVRVKGTFFKLKEVKDSFDRLHSSGNTVTPSSSSGAISKRSNKSVHRSPSASFHHHSTLHESRSHSSPHSGQRGSARSGKESFVVEADVFDYAKKLRDKDMNHILEGQHVTMEVCKADESVIVTLCGKNSIEAAGQLQHFLNNLYRSLRTQEVRLDDMDHRGMALLRSIQEDRNSSVLVRKEGNKLLVIGTSSESYNIKQKLLEKEQEPPRQTSQILDNTPISTSNVVSPRSQNTTARQNRSASWWSCLFPIATMVPKRKKRSKCNT
ncbi:uncharacterized protein V6R79_018260 [Siganus canaliculatus]